MDSSDLTPAQTAQLLTTLRRHLSFLHRLQQRMDRLGFPPADPLYRATALARNETGALYVCALYCASPGRIGLAARPFTSGAALPVAPEVPTPPETARADVDVPVAPGRPRTRDRP